MSRRLREASFHVVEGHSVVVPLAIDGLPDQLDVLGIRYERKREFHMTAVPATFIEDAGRTQPAAWETAVRVLSGRSVGPISARDDVRAVTRPDHPDDSLRTLIVMVDAPGLVPLYRDLEAALATPMTPPPAHITLYSTDPADGIGIEDERRLAERAPVLSAEEQAEVKRAMGFDRVFEDHEAPRD